MDDAAAAAAAAAANATTTTTTTTTTTKKVRHRRLVHDGNPKRKQGRVSGGKGDARPGYKFYCSRCTASDYTRRGMKRHYKSCSKAGHGFVIRDVYDQNEVGALFVERRET